MVASIIQEELDNKRPERVSFTYRYVFNDFNNCATSKITKKKSQKKLRITTVQVHVTRFVFAIIV